MQSLDQILDGVERIEADALTRFNQLARAVDAGEPIETATVVDVLRAAGRTKENLASVVRLLEKRRLLRKRINDIDRFRERSLELRRLVDEANVELEKHVAEHQERCRPLQSELSEIERRRMSWGDPQQELVRSCEDPELRRQMESLLRQRHLASEKLDQTRGNLRRAQAAVGGHDYVRFADERKKIDRWVDRAKKEFAEVESEISQLVQATDAVEASMQSW